MPNKHVNVHLLTDSTGETLGNIINAITSQFPSYKIKVFSWPFTTTIGKINPALDLIEKEGGIIMYSILAENLLSYMKERLQNKPNITIIPALDSIMEQFTSHLQIDKPKFSQRQGLRDTEYLSRVQSMEYTMLHDDGKAADEKDISEADIVILGVSRSGKTPTSAYLGYRGYKVMNIPFISEGIMPNLNKFEKPLVVALQIDPIRLLDLRNSRILSPQNKNLTNQSNYVDLQSIQDECFRARKYFNKINCHTIDSTQRSIEEIAAYIIRLYNIKNS